MITRFSSAIHSRPRSRAWRRARGPRFATHGFGVFSLGSFGCCGCGGGSLVCTTSCTNPLLSATVTDTQFAPGGLAATYTADVLAALGAIASGPISGTSWTSSTAALVASVVPGALCSPGPYAPGDYLAYVLTCNNNLPTNPYQWTMMVHFTAVEAANLGLSPPVAQWVRAAGGVLGSYTQSGSTCTPFSVTGSQTLCACCASGTVTWSP